MMHADISMASVYGLYILETAQTALSTGDAVRWFASGFGNMIDLSKPFFSAIDAPIMDGIIAFVVQLFFCWRIWVLGKSWPFSIAIAVVSTCLSCCYRQLNSHSFKGIDSATRWWDC